MNLKHFNQHAFCLVIAAVSLTACNTGTTISTPDGKVKINADRDGATYTATSAGGASVNVASGNAAVYPANYPMPQYPGSKVQMTIGSQMNSGMADNAMLTTSDSVDKVVTFYKNFFGSNGWKIDTEFKGEGTAMLSASNGEKTAQVTASPTSKDSGSETSISLAIQKK